MTHRLRKLNLTQKLTIISVALSIAFIVLTVFEGWEGALLTIAWWLFFGLMYYVYYREEKKWKEKTSGIIVG